MKLGTDLISSVAEDEHEKGVWVLMIIYDNKIIKHNLPFKILAITSWLFIRKLNI